MCAPPQIVLNEPPSPRARVICRPCVEFRPLPALGGEFSRELGTELLDGSASDVLFFDQVGTAIDGGDERGMRDPESGPQIPSGARPVELREHLDRGSCQSGV